MASCTQDIVVHILTKFYTNCFSSNDYNKKNKIANLKKKKLGKHFRWFKQYNSMKITILINLVIFHCLS